METIFTQKLKGMMLTLLYKVTCIDENYLYI